jgi:hypothetical protein
MASSNPIIIYRGEHVYIPFQMTPNTDITGWTLRMHVAKKYDAAVKLLSDLAPEITAPATGAFRFLLTAEQTDLKPGGPTSTTNAWWRSAFSPSRVWSGSRPHDPSRPGRRGYPRRYPLP